MLSPPPPATSAKQRVALVLMGAWLAGTVCTSVVATENFYTIDRLLAGSPNAAFSAALQRLGPPEARDLLRYLSSELNRLYFQLTMWITRAVSPARASCTDNLLQGRASRASRQAARPGTSNPTASPTRVAPRTSQTPTPLSNL